MNSNFLDWSLSTDSPAATGLSHQDVIVGTADDDVLNGTTGADTILGLAGDDVLSGRSGDDHLSGSGGDDSLFGGSGDDVLDGGPGQNTLMGGSGDDFISVRSLASELIDGGSGFDTASFSLSRHAVKITVGLSETSSMQSIEAVVGSNFGDQLSATGSAHHLLDGGDGNDTLGGGGHTDMIGGGGDDMIFGAIVGAAQISGGDGDDSISAGAGAVIDAGDGDDQIVTWLQRGATITGGTGADTITIGQLHNAPHPAAPEITDLASEDTIDLSHLDADGNRRNGDQAFVLVSVLDGHAGEAALSYDSGTNVTTLLLDTDGDGTANWTVLLDGDQTGFTNFVL